MKRIILLSLISSNAFATQLTLEPADTRIRIEYDTKSEEVKMLEKPKDKKCLKQLKESKTLLKSVTRGKSGSIKMTFICK